MELLRWSLENALKLYARLNSNGNAAWRDAAVSAHVDSTRSGTILRQQVILGDSDEARMDLLERAERANTSGVDRADLPRIDINEVVARLRDGKATLEAALRRHGESLGIATAAELGELQGEVAEEG
eukprot:507264-Pleurochrysis_carterae.AAC.2